MNTRLARPVVVAAVGGALLAGSALVGTPAFANPGVPTGPTAQKPPTATEQPSITRDAAGPGTPAAGLADLSVPDASIAGARAARAAEPDPTVPTGTFRLNYTSVWNGQQITIGQGLDEFHDDGDDDSTLTRVVSWGDGTSTVLGPTTFAAAKSYSRAGNYAVTVVITDPSGNVSAIPPKTVAVTVPAGKVTLNKTSAYQGAPFNVKIDKVPAGATSYRIDWSDGSFSTHSASRRTLNGAYLHYYWKWDAARNTWVRNGNGRISGARMLKIAWGNSKGYSSYQNAATIKILKDGWKPTVSIKKPASPSKASSWKTISGTATDKGSGLRHVGFTAFRVTSTGKAYCLTPQKKWKRYYTDADVNKYCYATGYKLKIVNGKWSIKLPAGVTSNQFIAVEIWAYDLANNYRTTYRTAKLTRS